jgi:Leucine-rich repeat (LRR) protein
MFSHNALTNIDVSKNILLSSFWGSYNKLTSLDFTNNSALIYVQCQFNRLIYLNIKNGNNLNFVDLNATNNPNLTCIEVDDASWSAANWTNIDAVSSFNENCHYNDTYVPDDNFENYLEANGMGNGIANDDYVTTANINTVTTLNVSSKNIADLTGIEDFNALEDLRCHINQLTSLNVTQNSALTVLHAYQNEISALDVSLNTNLTDLRCNNNLLTTLDVTQNTALVKLHNYSNQLTTINVTLNTALQQLYSNNNQLTSIDVSQNTTLTHFYSYNNPLGSLDVTQNTALAYLQCNNNQLTELDVSQNTALFRLFCQDNLLTSLNIKNGNNINMAGQFYNSSNNPNLTCIEVDDATYSASNWTNKDAASSFSEDCSNFDLTYVPDDNLEHYLETHDSSGNFVSVGSANSMGNGVDYDDYVTTSKINTISYLNINTRSIVDLTGIEDFTALSLFYCINNQITSLDLSNNLSLREIYCSGNSINTINVSQNTNLEHLTAANNQLITIDVSQNPLLDHLDVSRNLITNLDTSQNTNLIRLRCFTNQITSLDVTQSVNLIEISCYGNQLTTLDISQNINLTDLICSQNQLTSLDVSQNVVLSGLRCQDNQLTRLNAANGNNFSITNNVYFNTINNPNLTCIEVDDVSYSTVNWTNIDATSSFSTNCHYNETYVPDDNFENYLETHDANGNIVTIGATNSMGNGIANDDYVTTININSVTNLDVSSKSILDLTGIADFSQLLVLNIGSNNNIVFDISQNTVLESLHCHSSSLISAALNISQNTALKNLYCQNNQLTTLDVSSNLNLETLNCFQNSITTLDISGNSSLISLFATNNQLTNLNVKNTNNTNFTLFNATNNPNLTCIEVDNATYSRTNWTNIDATSNFNNNCTTPEVYVPDDNFETYLETHDANGNVVPLGDTSSMGNGILLDDYVTLSKIANVSTLNIPNLNIQNIIGIEYFSNLSNLNCSNNSINNIDVSQNTALTVFSCSFNQISNINISTNTNLFHLNVSNNNLGNIDISNNTALTFLNCENNQINNLNVNQNNLLTHLAVNNNLLTVIDLTQNLSLVTFICDFNKLSTLNLSLHTVLQQLSAVDNQLAYLNIKNGNNINFNIFYSSGNQNLTCIIVDDSSYSDLNWSSFKDTTSTFVNNQSECAALATNEYNSLEFSLYPNPTNGSINVTILEKAELIIYSLIGKELKKVKLNSGKNEITHLNLANGIYLFKVVGKDKSSTKKVLVN